MCQQGKVGPFHIVNALVDGRIHQPRVERVPILVTAEGHHDHRRAVADGNRVDHAAPRCPGSTKRHGTNGDARQHLRYGARLAYLNVHGGWLVMATVVVRIVTPRAVWKGLDP